MASLLADIRDVRRMLLSIEKADCTWAENFRKQILNDTSQTEALVALGDLGTDFTSALERRQVFLSRPVHVPSPAVKHDEVVLAIANLSEGKRAFGTFGIFGKSEQKKLIDCHNRSWSSAQTRRGLEARP